MNEQHETTFLCGGDIRPGPRDKCPHPLHDWPLPSGYCDAAEVAASRLAHGWANTRCPRCGLYGWAAGRPTPHNDTRVQAPAEQGGGAGEQLEPGPPPDRATPAGYRAHLRRRAAEYQRAAATYTAAGNTAQAAVYRLVAAELRDTAAEPDHQ